MASNIPNYVIVDTNVLIYAVQRRIRLEDAVLEIPGISTIVIPSCVMAELYGLSRRNVDAKVAYEYCRRFRIIEAPGKGDECIISAAKQTGAMVITNDKELAQRLIRSGLRAGMLSGKKIIF
ncbi:hypothetical protein DMB44_03975 [Thermoplasma sp. Kam2015]|uniref:type II toxin-antitoxin system VapC family toxin n=1 Tax=Thermoplasma sp. Kam2015 TaxID=2094122 RepID=UPI000D922894|nr:PIN domain-containing protein [Thermoplasma sp. Kam2015]PYB68503.1 hypothetical protein DMB44_03975 [Thermoplasma sp. Kam2015]